MPGEPAGRSPRAYTECDRPAATTGVRARTAARMPAVPTRWATTGFPEARNQPEEEPKAPGWHAAEQSAVHEVVLPSPRQGLVLPREVGILGQVPLVPEMVQAGQRPPVAPPDDVVRQVAPLEGAAAKVGDDRCGLEVNGSAGLMDHEAEVQILADAQHVFVEGADLGENLAASHQTVELRDLGSFALELIVHVSQPLALPPDLVHHVPLGPPYLLFNPHVALATREVDSLM